MPIYEYTCPSCDTTFEEWIRSATDENSDHYACPYCNTEAQRVLSPSTFILKGGGWYVTEYGGKSTESEKNALNSDADSADTTTRAEESAPSTSKEADNSSHADKAVGANKAETKNTDSGQAPAKAASAHNSGTEKSAKYSAGKNSSASTPASS